MKTRIPFLIYIFLSFSLTTIYHSAVAETQLRARDIGIAPGILTPGKHNAITDVAGVLIGHTTLHKGESIRTGVTAILPHNGNIYQNKVPAAMVIGNGFGKMTGYSQVHELGEIETPIVLTNTLSVPTAAKALVNWTLSQKGNETVRSVNSVVGETNDGKLNDIRGQHISEAMVLAAINSATTGRVAEGAVGAGTGTVSFGWKGGIGTASRVLPQTLGGYTVGVLVQSNYGGVLQLDGIPIGKSLNQYYLKKYVNNDTADGSIMIIVATDAPLSDRNLRRLGNRAMTGLARTGTSMSNGSGDYVISFSTAENVRRTKEKRNKLSDFAELPNNKMTPLFQATIEATEEAIYNSLLMAKTTTSKNTITGKTTTIKKLPIDKVQELIKRYHSQ